MNDLILATSNKGKIAELKALLAPINCLSQKDLNISSAEETGLSFIENAIIKARHASQIAKKPALADDSGLVVTSLLGEPGSYSARYAGVDATDDDNINLLLKNMKNFEGLERQAYFYCAIALVRHANDPVPLIATGKLHGQIWSKRQGNHGFGYDPIFYIKSYNCTLAEIPAQIKNTISHRAIALKQLRNQMDNMKND